MDLLNFIAEPARRDALAAACETSADYLWQVATGWRGRRAGPGLARRIEAESDRIGPERVPKESIRPDLWESMVDAEPKATRRRKVG